MGDAASDRRFTGSGKTIQPEDALQRRVAVLEPLGDFVQKLLTGTRQAGCGRARRVESSLDDRLQLAQGVCASHE
jgi:hypothetical protein